jgi:hypothetical protein
MYAPYDTIVIDGKEKMCYRDVFAWDHTLPLDIFYWLSYSYIDPGTGLMTESEKTNPITNLHPQAVHYLEEVRSFIVDDLSKFYPDKGVFEQLGTYNLKIAMDNALDDINSEPHETTFGYGNYPKVWGYMLVLGTIVNILPRLELLETAKQFTMNDQGQSLTPPDMSAKFAALRDYYTLEYNTRRQKIKRNHKPMPFGVGSSRTLFLAPNFVAWASVSTNRPFF